MAVIHKSKSGLRRRKRYAGALMILCWPLAAAAAVLTVAFYMECSSWLMQLAGAWRDALAARAASQPVDVQQAQAWMAALDTTLALLMQGAAWCVFGLTMAAPALLGAGAAILLIRLQKPSAERFAALRTQAQTEKAAMALLRQLPDACHLFLNRRLVFEGGTADMDVIVTGPGGTAVLDVKNWAGLIEGCVTEPVLYRKRQDGAVDKLRNPARQVVGHVTRLSNYLRSVNVSAGVVPCVLFVNPEASVYVRPPEETIISGRRTRISSCIMADATSFWELLGRELGAGRLLNESAVAQVVAAIEKAPRGKSKYR